MKVVSVISQKGGAGKTTLATNIAVAASLSGVRTFLADLDPQATARKWGDRRGRAPEVVSDHAARLPNLLESARAGGAGLVVIDTAPNADQASLAAAKSADIILIPCRPAVFDLEAISTTIDLAAIARRQAFVVLSAAPIRSTIVDEARKVITDQGAKVAPTVIHQRAAYGHASIDGRGVLEYEPGGKAAEEISALFGWLRDELGPLVRTRVRMSTKVQAA